MTRRSAAAKIEFSLSRSKARIEDGGGGGGGDWWWSVVPLVLRFEAMREENWIGEERANGAFYTLTQAEY